METPSLPPLCRTVQANAPRLDGSLEQVVAPRRSCCQAQRSHDFPNRDSRYACSRAPVGFSFPFSSNRRGCFLPPTNHLRHSSKRLREIFQCSFPIEREFQIRIAATSHIPARCSFPVHAGREVLAGRNEDQATMPWIRHTSTAPIRSDTPNLRSMRWT